MQMLEIGIGLCVALLIYGIIHIIYNVFYNVQQSKHARQKQGGIWYHIEYSYKVDGGMTKLFFNEWSRSNKPIGENFKVLRIENYNRYYGN